jgi:hypothetical protein
MPPSLERLAACAGTWHGTSRLHMPELGQPDESASTLTVTPVLGGRFVRLDYTWAFQGQPQEGSMLVGHENEGNADTAYWVDTFHTPDKAMLFRGDAGEGDAITVKASWAAPPGPDWGWDIVLTPQPGAALSMVMHIYTPEGEMAPAVEAAYTPG